MVDISDICGHPAPVRGEAASAMVMCDLSASGMPGKWEQIWAEKLPNGNFRLNSLPFFAADLALDDEVSAKESENGLYWLLDSVVKESSNATLRIAFQSDLSDRDVESRQSEIIGIAHSLGLLHEVHQLGYFAINCDRSDVGLETLYSRLKELASQDIIYFEKSRRK